MVNAKTRMVMADVIRSLLKAKDTGVWSISPNATVYEAIAMMADRSVGALPVMEGERLVGIISERDYARRVILQGRLSKETQVNEIMTGPVVTVAPDYTVAQCMEIMTNRRIRHLPVVDQDKVVGMLSIGDLVKAIIAAQDDAITHLSSYIRGDYPA